MTTQPIRRFVASSSDSEFAPFPCHPSDRCFACGRLIGRLAESKLVDTRDGQQVFVGVECFKKVIRAGDAGYLPTKGGPRLYPVADDATDGAA